MIEIRHRDTGAVLFEGEHKTRRECVEAAVKAGADLFAANLFRANLSGANLSKADLSVANLSRANLSRADLFGANLFRADLSSITGNISKSHELLAAIALRFDESLTPVAAMIAGRYVGCWAEYTKAIRQVFGEDVMRRLWQAWSQGESWGVVEKMREHGWPEPV